MKTETEISAGLMAGAYFAFSSFIMQAFDRLGAAHAIGAMNTINQVILRSWFMVLFFGSTIVYACLSAVALFDTDLPARWNHLRCVCSLLGLVLSMFYLVHYT